MIKTKKLNGRKRIAKTWGKTNIKQKGIVKDEKQSRKAKKHEHVYRKHEEHKCKKIKRKSR